MIHDLPIDLVYPNPKQPRTIFKREDLEELAASIQQHGLLQPIKVRPDADGRFMIVLGERRWRAHGLLQRKTIPATVMDMSDGDLADAAIVENLQRRDITPLEEARAFQARIDAGLTVDELAERLGIKQVRRITERTALLKLAPEYQDALSRGILTPSQAGEMCRLGVTSQRILFDAIREGRCRTFPELRRVAQSLLDAENQTEMWAESKPTEAERGAVRGLEAKIERVCGILQGGFDENEIVIVRRVNPLKADVFADQLELIESSLKQLRLALRASVVTSRRAEVVAVETSPLFPCNPCA
jgi:ParB family chromosome partitioning protein